MAEFNSFAAFGEKLISAGYELRPDRRPSYRRALHKAGEEFRDYFRMKIEVSGPDWPTLSERTQEQRARAGLNSDQPLAATLQMYEAIDFEVVGDRLNVGIHDKDHIHGYVKDKGGQPRTVPMGDLFLMHEIGTSTMPARPIFTDTDFFDIQNKVTHNFMRHMLENGFLRRLR